MTGWELLISNSSYREFNMWANILIITLKYVVRLIVGFVCGGIAALSIILFIFDAYGDLKYGLDVQYILGENWFTPVFLIGGTILSIVVGLIGGVKINIKWTIILSTVLTFYVISLLAASILAIPLSNIDKNSGLFSKIAPGIVRRTIFTWSIIGTCIGIVTGYILSRIIIAKRQLNRLEKPSPIDDL